MGLDQILQAFDLLDFSGLHIDPIDFLVESLSSIGGFVFRAKVCHQLDIEIHSPFHPPIIINMKKCVKRRLDESGQGWNSRQIGHASSPR